MKPEILPTYFETTFGLDAGLLRNNVDRAVIETAGWRLDSARLEADICAIATISMDHSSSRGHPAQDSDREGRNTRPGSTVVP